MAFPVSPDDVKNALPSPSSSICQKMVSALIQLPTLFYRIITWAVNSDLSASDALKAWLGLSVGSQLAAPTGLVATGAATSITLTWNSVAAATSYDVYRSLTPVPPTIGSPLISGLTVLTFVDSAAVPSTPAFAVGTRYYYLVVSRNSSTSSTYSNSATAIAGTVVSGATFGFGSGVTQTFTAPANGNYDFYLYGGGAGGGSSFSGSTFGNPTGQYPGGGGGGGSERRVITLALLLNDVISINVGAGGAGGPVSPASGSQSGSSGGDTFITKGGIEQARAKGGGGGGGATNPIGGSAGTGGSGGAGTAGSAGSAGTATGGGNGGAAIAGGTGKGGQGGTPVTVTNPQGPILGGTDGQAGDAGEVVVTF